MSTISATAKLNTLNVSFWTLVKAALRQAVASKAFALVCGIVLFGAVMYVMILVCTMILNACVWVFGETLGLVVYFMISVGLCFAAEWFGRWAAVRVVRAQFRAARA